MQRERYAVIDVETTGFSATRDRIVEVACALIDGERIVGRWATLVDPGIAIPAYATAVHGITDEMVGGAPRLGRALEPLRRRCKGPKRPTIRIRPCGDSSASIGPPAKSLKRIALSATPWSARTFSSHAGAGSAPATPTNPGSGSLGVRPSSRWNRTEYRTRRLEFAALGKAQAGVSASVRYGLCC